MLEELIETAATPARRSSDLPDGEAGVRRGDECPDPLVCGLVQPRRRQAQALVDLLVAQEALSRMVKKFMRPHVRSISATPRAVRDTVSGLHALPLG
jgi:hypothetical protein